jgi:TonB family protein
MNRLQKKCFLVSAGMHVLLPVILVLGSALTPKSKPHDNMPILDIIPLITTEKQATGDGNRNVRTALPQFNQPVTPPQPAPKPKLAEKADDPDPPKDSPEESFEPRKDSNKRKLPNVPTALTTRKNPNAAKTTPRRMVDDSAEREANETRKKLADALASAAHDLRDNTSTTVKFTDGFAGSGTDGVPYGNFLAAVKTIYTRAWNVPDGDENEDATAEVSVTIAKDGKVLSASIIRKSGNSRVDLSVQMTLDRVRYVAPLPATDTKGERTVTIGFNAKARRGL